MTFGSHRQGERGRGRNEALLRTVMVHGVPVRTLAAAMGVSRQTVYRRMEQARTQMRRLASAAEQESKRP
jgi:DNA-directed RNA polymerase specialized sigma24 family protein